MNRTHGHSTHTTGSPTYATWRNMKQRVTNPLNTNYRYYGGRGITLDPRWYVFENFLADMGERPEGMTLDRIDHDGNYEPSNCRWATSSEQRLNRRLPRCLDCGSFKVGVP